MKPTKPHPLGGPRVNFVFFGHTKRHFRNMFFFGGFLSKSKQMVGGGKGGGQVLGVVLNVFCFVCFGGDVGVFFFLGGGVGFGIIWRFWFSLGVCWDGFILQKRILHSLNGVIPKCLRWSWPLAVIQS